ncbi:MAG TPA: ABC transporter ATP-binding protein [Flavisolibacter sp.]|jgi:peptide/nickel transport system ATP-binding protein|nr:ABC transporter ATP-binding protein [Flavisolibacter sp.]
MQPLLSIENLSVDFITEQRTTNAVKNISLQVNRGDILAIVGESGSGKSVTSLSILQLLPKPPANYSSGKIIFQDGNTTLDLIGANQKQIREIRGSKIAMIFQEPMTSLNPVMSCGKQVMEALFIHKKVSSAEAKKQTIEWFEKVKLPQPEKIFSRYPHELSGGQKQRVMIAMAMCCHPSLLICDEPTTALDVTVQKTILQLIKELQQQEDMGVIFITHDLGVVAEIADCVAIMYKGEIVEQNTTKNVFNHPQNPYTQALIACRPAAHRKNERLPVVSDFLGNENSNKRSKDGSLRSEPEDHSVTSYQRQGEVLVTVENLAVQFPGKTNLLGKPKNYFTAVDDVSFEIFKGETLGLVGESGCGKTTLGRTLLGLIEPASGKIFYANADITRLSKEQLKAIRKDVQLIFQDPYSSLNPRLTIGDAIAEPMKITGIEKTIRERKKKVADLLERVSLSPNMTNRYPHEFSGGQRQRIVIARALSMNPDFIVCDESVSALDVSVQAQVLNLLNELKRELGLTMLFISHDLSVVRYMCDRIMVMKKGKIIEAGNAEEVYYRPKDAYTRQLIEAIPKIPVE